MVPRYRHWKNFGQGGSCVFVTSTTLDFAHAFATDEQKELLTASVLTDCIRFDATLHAFAVMSNHIHLLFTLPDGLDASNFMRRVKSNSALRVLPTLGDDQKRALGIQQGLGGRQLWKRGFRGVPIFTHEACFRKLDYIAYNPVRAKLCASPEEYRWSSFHAVEQGARTVDNDLDMAKALELYGSAR